MNWFSGEIVEISGEIVDLLNFLLPGFITAAIFHSLTSHRKPSAFERIVSALIFTVLINATISILSLISILDKAPNFLPEIIAVVGVGLIASVISNKDCIHKLFRWLRLTDETSYPSEWESTFIYHGNKSAIVLYLKDSRRLYGQLVEWPSDPQVGHFRIIKVEWIDSDNSSIPFEMDSAVVLVPAAEVKMLALAPMIDDSKSEGQNRWRWLMWPGSDSSPS